MGSYKCSTFNSLIPTIHQSPVRFHTFADNYVVVQIRLEHQSILRWKRPFLASPFFSWLEGIHKRCMTKNHKHWYWISIQYIVIRYIYISPLPSQKSHCFVGYRSDICHWYLSDIPASSRRTKPWRSGQIPRCTKNNIGTVGVRTVTMGISWLILIISIID